MVTPNPDNAPALHDVQLASGVKEVRAFVGRPRAVQGCHQQGVQRRHPRLRDA
ncbi:MAG: hypothetical protein QM756_21535 [Polyangiaceae bacterium]